MIDLAIQSFPKREYSNLGFKKVSAEQMQFEQFADVVLIMNTLHWIRDPWTALCNVASAIKPGGILFILTYPKESSYWTFLEETVKKAECAAYKEQSAFRTIHFSHEYARMLNEVGLKIDQSSLEEKIAIYHSNEELSDYIKGWLNCYLPLPKECEDAFLKKAVHNASLFSLCSNNEEIHLPYSKLTIKARK